MATLGTIMLSDAPGGRSPWSPAAFMSDTAGIGVALAGTDYYDRMDNLTSRSIYQAGGGAYLGWRRLRLKAGLLQFNVLDTYFEQEASGSVAVDIAGLVAAGVGAHGHRLVLAGRPSDNRRVIAELDISAWVPWRYAALSLTCAHLPLAVASSPEIIPPLTIRTGVHTTANRIGAQGVLIEVTPANTRPVRFAAGEEVRLGSNVALQGAFATNPVFLSIGVVVSGAHFGLGSALVHHPLLGWSRGFAAEYGWHCP